MFALQGWDEMGRDGLEKNACQWQWDSVGVHLNSRFLKRRDSRRVRGAFLW